MKKNKGKNYIAIFLFMLVLVGPTISWAVISILSIEKPYIMRELDFDLGENRNKASMSNALNVENFSSEFEKYYNDRVPYRSILIYTKKDIDSSIEKPYDKIFDSFVTKGARQKIIKIAKSDEVFMDDAVDVYYNHGLRPGDVDPYNPYIDYPVKYLSDSNNIFVGQSDWLYLNDINIDYYTGKNSISTPSYLKKHIYPYANLVNKADKVGKKVVILIAPEKEEVYPEYMPKLTITDEIELPIYIKDYLNKNYKHINYLYPKKDLIDAKNKYLTYRKYDSHWNSVGGYIAATKIKEAFGYDSIPLRDIHIERTNKTDNTLVTYGGGNINNFQKTFEYKFAYRPEAEVDVFFSEDELRNSFSTRSSKPEINERLFIIGDSFRGGPAEFLIKDYNEVYCNSYVNLSKSFIKEEIKRADSILIIVVERNEGALLTNICDNIYNVLCEYENDINELIKKNSKK